MAGKPEKGPREEVRDEQREQNEDWRDEPPSNFKGPLAEVDDEDEEDRD